MDGGRQTAVLLSIVGGVVVFVRPAQYVNFRVEDLKLSFSSVGLGGVQKVRDICVCVAGRGSGRVARGDFRGFIIENLGETGCLPVVLRCAKAGPGLRRRAGRLWEGKEAEPAGCCAL